MNVRHVNSITGAGSPASARVASSLTPRAAAANRTTGIAKPRDTSSNTNAAAADPSDITSSDFLTLLVSELQNQDPTQPTDPNAYISQLVEVNSLQQLIQINQGLSSVESVGASSGSQDGSSNDVRSSVAHANPANQAPAQRSSNGDQALS